MNQYHIYHKIQHPKTALLSAKTEFIKNLSSQTIKHTINIILNHQFIMHVPGESVQHRNHCIWLFHQLKKCYSEKQIDFQGFHTRIFLHRHINWLFRHFRRNVPYLVVHRWRWDWRVKETEATVGWRFPREIISHHRRLFRLGRHRVPLNDLSIHLRQWEARSISELGACPLQLCLLPTLNRVCFKMNWETYIC